VGVGYKGAGADVVDIYHYNDRKSCANYPKEWFVGVGYKGAGADVVDIYHF